MPTISEAIKKNTLRYLAGGQPGQPVPAQPQPVGTPPQDLTIPLPRRGDFTPGLLPVNQSDFADQNRTAGGERSGVFLPQPPPQVSSGKAVAGTTNFGIWNPKATYETGNGVAFNGSLYIANTPNSNEQPNPIPSQVATPSSWTLVGSSSADNVQAGEYFAPVSVRATNATGQVDLSLPDILPNGSIAPNSNSAFSYSATSTTVTLVWSGFNIFQVNGNVISVANGSQTITGLTAGTNYYVFPYFNPANSTIGFIQTSQVANLQALAGMSVSGSGYVTTTTSITPNTSSSHYSVELWVYPTANSGCLMSLGPGGPAIQMDAASSGPYTLSVTPSTGSSGAINGGTLLANFWNYVVVVFDYGGGAGGTCLITVYLNGTQVNSTSSNPSTISASKWTIACSSTNGGQGTAPSGIFAFCAVYGATLLTSAQVSNHLNIMLNGGVGAYAAQVITDGATYLWELAETSGTTATDSSDSNTGTYNGTFTLNDSQTIAGTNGSPSIAWQNPSIQVATAQFAQNYIPLTPGAMLVATPATGSAAGVLASFPVPGLPSSLPFAI